MVRSPIIGIGRHKDLLILHEIHVQRDIDSQFQHVEDEDVGTIHWTVEPPKLDIKSFSKVIEQQVKHNGLVQSSRGQVGCSGGGEGDPHLLRQRVHVHRQDGGGLAAHWHVHRGDAA